MVRGEATLGDTGGRFPHDSRETSPCVTPESLCRWKGEVSDLTLSGKIFLKGKLVREGLAEDNEQDHSFREKLEKCLIELCADVDIPVPLWLKKNTKELAIFRRTFFSSEQFIDKVWFDKLEIKLGE